MATVQQAFRAWMRWHWAAQAGSLIGLLVILLFIAGAVSPSRPESASQARQQPTAVQQQPVVAEVAAPDAAPTNAVVAVATPYPFTSEDVARSIRDNRSFMGRASVENLDVQVSGGTVLVSVQPRTVLNEADSLTVVSQTGLVASKAVWSTYPDAQLIRTVILGEFTTPTGQTSTQPAAQFDIPRSTGDQFAYDGLKSRVTSDNKHMFCLASAYRIHVAVYNSLTDKGCLRGAVK